MLKKAEYLVLKIIIDSAVKGVDCLISPSNIVAFIGNPKIVNLNNVDKIVKNLDANEYIDALITDRKGEKLYSVKILKKGKNYKAENKREIALIRNKILLAVIGACISFIVGRILIAIFS